MFQRSIGLKRSTEMGLLNLSQALPDATTAPAMGLRAINLRAA